MKRVLSAVVKLCGIFLIVFAVLFQLSTVFADGPSVKIYDQCANDDGDGYVSPPGDLGCHWTNGNIQSNNSQYHEGEATVQRLLLEDATGIHTVRFKYGTTKGGTHAYDFLTNDDFSELNPNPLTAVDLCDDTGSTKLPSCASIPVSPDTADSAIPQDPNADGFDNFARHFRIRNGIIDDVSTPTVVSGTYAGDSETVVTVTFHVNPATCTNGYNSGNNQNPVPACAVLITFGAHISTQEDWGTGNSAVDIEGSPYHVALDAVDGTSIGQRDNQMQAAAIVTTPTVTTELHNAAHGVVNVGSTVPLGTVMHDTVTVTGSEPTGSITLKFFNNGTCTGDPLTTSGNINLTNGAVDATGFAQGPLAAGNYGFLAHYNGDNNNTEADGICENFTVGKAQLEVVTQVHNTNHANVTNTTVPLGSVVHDTAVVSGAVSGFATPVVAFTFYANGTCESQGTSVANIGADEVAAAVRSAASSALTAGSYSYKASVTENANYLGDNADCEPFTVGKANTSVTTAIHLNNDHTVDVQGTTIPLNSSIHDQATVGGLLSGISSTGTLTYNFYQNNSCDGTPFAVDANVSLNSESSVKANLPAGGYSFLASFSGDANYNQSIGICEVVTVGKANTATTTQVHNTAHQDVTNTTIALGSVVHDNATVNAQVGDFVIGGTVTYIFFTNGACEENGTAQAPVAVGSESNTTSTLGAGSYSYLATYSGDANYNGSVGICEPFSVGKVTPTVATELHKADEGVVPINTSVPLGTTMHDQASVTGLVNGFAPENVNFRFYSNNNCSGDGVASGSAAVNGSGIAHPSSNQGPLAAGSYSFRASVPENANYNTATSDCEPFTVDKAQLTTATQVHNSAHANVTNSSVTLGSIVHDTATLNGAVSGFATPAITFTFYTNGTCAESGTAVDNIGAEGNAVRSAASSALAAGSYAYKASVAGNDNYNGDDSDCEPFTVNKAQLRISTNVHNADHDDITDDNAPLGTVTHDTATVSGDVDGFALPAVTFTLTSNFGEACDSGSPVDTVGNEGGAARSADSAALGAGEYAYRAVVGSNDNYEGATGICEPFTIDKAQLGITTNVHNVAHADITNASAPLGSVTHDTATVTGGVGSFALPDVSFTLTSNYTDSCSNGAAVATNGLEDTKVKSADSAPMAAGNYAYRAVVAGNDNYIGAAGICEPFTINKATPGITTTLHNNDESVIGAEAATDTVHDRADVTGAVDGFPLDGNVNFSFFNNGTCAPTGEAAGTVALDNGVAHPSQSRGPLVAGSYSYRATYTGNTDYNEVTSDCEPFTVTKLTINKLANGGNDTFGYTVSGPTNATPDITTSGEPGEGTVTLVVLAGQYTVGETTIPSGWQLVSLSCAGGNPTLGPTSAPFNIPAGTNAICNFENTRNNATRTQGFWSTHTVFANDTWMNDVPPNERDLRNWGAGCTGPGSVIDATVTPLGQNELMGGFWSNIANKSVGGKRQNIDKTRMQMLQQLLAAMLNRWGIGTSDGGLIDQAQAALCANNQNAIQQKIGQLGAFNEGGDDIPLGFSVPNATPKASKAQANIVFWDNPTAH